jgi:hypothetical protein
LPVLQEEYSRGQLNKDTIFAVSSLTSSFLINKKWQYKLSIGTKIGSVNRKNVQETKL